MLHCRKVAPPTKEEIEAKIKEEDEEVLKVVAEVKEEEEEKVENEVVDKEVTLPHASGMAYFRPGAE
jgi:hypothetical protein